MSEVANSSDDLSQRLAPIFARYPAIAAAYLFGSRARGDARPDSDLDVGMVYLRDGCADHDRVVTNLTADIGRATGIEAVDVVDLEAQGPIFCHCVLRDGQRVYEADAERRVDFESSVIAEALDFRPTYDLATSIKPRALRRWLRDRYDVRTDSDEAGCPESEPREAR